MNKQNSFLRAAIASPCIAIGASSQAASVDISFTRLTANAAENVASQLNATLSTVSGQPGMVDFIFTNNVGVDSSVSEIYFDNGNPAMHFASGAIVGQVGTEFVFGGADPGNLPSGENMDPSFNATSVFSSDAQGNPSKGIDTSTDLLTIRMTLLASLTYQDVVDALESSDLRIGLHLRSIGSGGESDNFINNSIAPVPAPLSSLLGLAGLGMLASRRRRSTC